MTKPTENDRLKARIKALEQRVQGLAKDIEADENDLLAFKAKCLDERMEVLNLQTKVGKLGRDLKYEDKLLGKTTAHLASRIVEFKDRIGALENFVFKHAGDLGDLQRIIGPLNDKTPPHLDRPKGVPRRR